MKLRRNPITIIYSAVFVLVMALALMNLAVLTYEKFAVDGLQNVLAAIVLVLILIFFIGAFFIKEGEKFKGIESSSSALRILDIVLLVASVGIAVYLASDSDIIEGAWIAGYLLLVFAICKIVGGRLCSLTGLITSLVSVEYYYEIGNSKFVTEDLIDVFCILVPFLLFLILTKYIVPALSKKGLALALCEIVVGAVFAISIVTNHVTVWLLIGCFLSVIFGRGKEAYNTKTKGIVVGLVVLISAVIFTVVVTYVLGEEITSLIDISFADGFNKAMSDGGLVSYGFEKISDELMAFIIAPYPYGIFPTVLAIFATLGGVYTALRKISDFGGFILVTIGSFVWYVACAIDNSNNHYYLFLIPIAAAYGFYNSLLPERLSTYDEDEEEDEGEEESQDLDALLGSAGASDAGTDEKKGEVKKDSTDAGKDSSGHKIVDDMDAAAKNAAIEAFKKELDQREADRIREAKEAEEEANKRTIEDLTESLAEMNSDRDDAHSGYSSPIPLQKKIESQAPDLNAQKEESSSVDNAENTTSTPSAGISGSGASASDSHFMEWHVSEEYMREEEIAAMKAAKKAEEEAAAAETASTGTLDNEDNDESISTEQQSDSDNTSENTVAEIPDDIDFGGSADKDETVELTNDIFGVPDTDEDENASLSGGTPDELDEEEKNVTLDLSSIKEERGDEEKNVTLDADVGYTETPSLKIDPSDTSMIGAVNEEEQPLADRRIPEEMQINAVNDGLDGAVQSSYIPEADSILGGAAKAKYESSEALLSTSNDDISDEEDDEEKAKEHAEELLSAIEHTIVPSVELPDSPNFDDDADKDNSNAGDSDDGESEDVSMMEMHKTIESKESLANEGLKAVDDIGGRLSAAAAALHGDGMTVISPGEDEMLDNLLNRLDMSDSIRRMTESARSDMADVIESDAEQADEDNGEDEVVLSNDAYDFGNDDEYGEVPTISDLEDRWRAEAELASVDDSDVPDVVSADELVEDTSDAEEVEDITSDTEEVEDITPDTEKELSEADEVEEQIPEDFSDDNVNEEAVDDFSFDDIDTTADELIGLDEIEEDTVDIDELEGATDTNVVSEEDIIPEDDVQENNEEPVVDKAIEEEIVIEPEHDESEIIEELPVEENKKVEFNDLVKLVFDDDENLGIPKPGEESTEQLERAISREKHRNLFDERVHTEEVVKRTSTGSRAYHKIVIRKDDEQ